MLRACVLEELKGHAHPVAHAQARHFQIERQQQRLESALGFSPWNPEACDGFVACMQIDDGHSGQNSFERSRKGRRKHSYPEAEKRTDWRTQIK